MSKRLMTMVAALAVGASIALSGTTLRAQSQEGIKVHGHWAIDVRQPDGTLVTHYEFENGLQGGGRTLGWILTRVYTPGSWRIAIVGPGNPCATGGNFCQIYEAGHPISAEPSVATNLVATSDATTGAITLVGSIRAIVAGTVATVGTAITLCGTDRTAADCLRLSAGPYGMTGTTLPQPINVAANQIIEFTITISFS